MDYKITFCHKEKYNTKKLSAWYNTTLSRPKLRQTENQINLIVYDLVWFVMSEDTHLKLNKKN